MLVTERGRERKASNGNQDELSDSWLKTDTVQTGLFGCD